MTLSPEARAQMIIDALCGDQHADARALIIAAIREAEDAALEMATAAAAGRVLRLMRASSDRNLIAQEACDAIRALKHKD